MKQEPKGVRQLDLTVLPGPRLSDRGEHERRQDVRAGDAQPRRGFRRGRLFHEIGHLEGAVVHGLARSDDAVVGDLLLANLFDRDHRMATLAVDVPELLRDGRVGHVDRVAEDHEEGFTADMLLGLQDRVAEAARLLLAHEVKVGLRGERLQVFVRLVRRRVLANGVPLRRRVEVVLDRSLLPSGDNQNIRDAGGDGLCDHPVNGGSVHDREHLLRLLFREREESGPEARGRDDGLHGRPNPRACINSSRP